MKVAMMALAVGTVVTSSATLAGDGEKVLQLRPKAAIGSAVMMPNAQHGQAPFVSPMGEPELVLMPRAPQAQDTVRSSCGERALCYDSASGRVVYRPAREYMPDVPGLRPENISIKRNQLVLRYSF
jgi:hypothetical protein